MLAVDAEMASEAGVQAVVNRTVDTFCGLDILVNNVGLARGARIEDTPDADWHEAIARRCSRPSAPRDWRCLI